MFFLPIGDDVNKRTFPMIGSILVALCVLVYAYEFRLYHELAESWPSRHLSHEERTSLILESDWYRFLLAWGVVPAELKTGRVYTLLTNIFVHYDFAHLFGNMIMLWALVGSLESALGSGRFLACYLIWGVLASAAQAAMQMVQGEIQVPAFGASGAIAGMIGAYFISFGALTKIRCMVWILIYPRIYNVPATAFIFFWFLTQLAGIAEATRPGELRGSGVAWMAHIGGFFAGMATMLVIGGGVRYHRDKSGMLSVEHQSLEFERRRKEWAALEEAARTTCPYCHNELGLREQLNESIYRCPNVSCERVVYR